MTAKTRGLTFPTYTERASTSSCSAFSAPSPSCVVSIAAELEPEAALSPVADPAAGFATEMLSCIACISRSSRSCRSSSASSWAWNQDQVGSRISALLNVSKKVCCLSPLRDPAHPLRIGNQPEAPSSLSRPFPGTLLRLLWTELVPTC